MIWRNQEKRNQEKGSGAASAIFAVTVYSADHGRKGEIIVRAKTTKKTTRNYSQSKDYKKKTTRKWCIR